MVKFPQELVDAIIDQLYQDRRALLACLSVSSFFRCRAQFHLFLSIPLAKEGDFEEFSLLCATSPSIPNLVKTLRVTLPESAISLPRLPYVHTLHLNGSLRVMSKDLGTFRRKFSWLPNTLTSLSIQNITFSSIETFRSLLGALPLLRSLSLLTVAAITTRSNNSHLLEPSRDDSGPPIEVLSITSINSDGVCAFFHGHPHLRPFALHRLRELHYFGFVVEQVTDIQRLLNESRDSLREFHLRPTFYSMPGLYSEGRVRVEYEAEKGAL
ncbi:uncharacterized protein EV420DRAFT_539328 [Desarmillaria tabescens]|uniref:F-box domain-containing protein n=1 Tax=Armillaria tabescens TaxID=1929756 RepID=A0AA39N3R8_ARMTA|nr:uncharacterized protein EV420DRAFT_539328 [Desarmillaria tabescens]KAK0457096.1 hypothetical protein EV420DRAFT_539328 [Desarmillaria tabescens]